MRLEKKKYIAAVSGGPDSMALLHKYQKIIVGVCHVNYHKRVDSDYDTSIVKQFCKDKKIKLAICDVKPQTYKNASEHNFQALARTIRYDFFVECSKKFKCKDLLIAHNLNDFLETAIMQQKRNSQNFFYGIKPVNKYKNVNIYRPLLKCFKNDLTQYCKDHKMDFAIDSSNASDIYERNRIRKQLNKLSKAKLLAMYKKFNTRNLQLARDEKEANSLLLNWQNSKYSVVYFKTIPQKQINNVIYLYLKKQKIANVNYNKIKLVRDYIVSNKSNNSLRLEQNIKLLKKDKKIKVIK